MVDIISFIHNLSEFEQHLRYERHLCESTTRNYVSQMRAFWDFTNIDDLSLTSRDHIREFLKSLDRKLTNSGIANYVTALRSYFNWLADKIKKPEMIELCLFLQKIIKIKRETIIVFVPTHEDIQRLRDMLMAHKKAAQIIGDNELLIKVLRETAAIELLTTGGFRSEELRSLRSCDIDLNESTAQITKGKGGHQRVSLFGGPAEKALQEYFSVYKFHDEQLIFPYSQGNILNVIIKRWAKKAGVSTKIHAHSFRHYFITEAQRQGVRIEDVASQVGHVNINTTRLYTHQNTAYLKDRFKNCNI